MIITISGANFSASNIGTLSTWTVSKSIGAGAEHSIPSYVDKNSAFNYEITLKDGYTFGTYSVTMGGQTITPTVTETSITIDIASVTGAIRIEVKTINSSTGEEEGGSGSGSMNTGTLPLTNYTLNVTTSGMGNYGSNNNKRLSTGSLTESNGILVKSGETITLSGLASGPYPLRVDGFYADIAGPNESISGPWSHAKGCIGDGSTNVFPLNQDGKDSVSITNTYGADYYFFFAFCGPTKNESIPATSYTINYAIN